MSVLISRADYNLVDAILSGVAIREAVGNGRHRVPAIAPRDCGRPWSLSHRGRAGRAFAPPHPPRCTPAASPGTSLLGGAVDPSDETFAAASARAARRWGSIPRRSPLGQMDERHHHRLRITFVGAVLGHMFAEPRGRRAPESPSPFPTRGVLIETRRSTSPATSTLPLPRARHLGDHRAARQGLLSSSASESVLGQFSRDVARRLAGAREPERQLRTPVHEPHEYRVPKLVFS
jgi:hypothetical protein